MELLRSVNTHVTHSRLEGIGLFLNEDPVPGDMILGCSREIVSIAESDAREKRLMVQKNTNDYMIYVGVTNEVIGAMNVNVARYCKHSCQPNSEYRIERKETFRRSTATKW